MKNNFMKQVYLQHWEVSMRNSGIIPDGCSLHLNFETRNQFVNSIYSKRNTEIIPDEYDKIIGDPIEVEVSDSIFNEMERNGNSLRLMQNSFSNLKALDEIILLDEDFL